MLEIVVLLNEYIKEHIFEIEIFSGLNFTTAWHGSQWVKEMTKRLGLIDMFRQT